MHRHTLKHNADHFHDREGCWDGVIADCLSNQWCHIICESRALRRVYSKAFCLWGNHASALFLPFYLFNLTNVKPSWAETNSPSEHSAWGYRQSLAWIVHGDIKRKCIHCKIIHWYSWPDLKALSKATSAGNLKWVLWYFFTLHVGCQWFSVLWTQVVWAVKAWWDAQLLPKALHAFSFLQTNSVLPVQLPTQSASSCKCLNAARIILRNWKIGSHLVIRTRLCSSVLMHAKLCWKSLKCGVVSLDVFMVGTSRWHYVTESLDVSCVGRFVLWWNHILHFYFTFRVFFTMSMVGYCYL